MRPSVRLSPLARGHVLLVASLALAAGPAAAGPFTFHHQASTDPGVTGLVHPDLGAIAAVWLDEEQRPGASATVTTPQPVDLAVVVNDCGRGEDAPATFNKAAPVATPAECEGAFLPLADESDWYRFDARDGDAIEVLVEPNDATRVRACIAVREGGVLTKTCSSARTGVPVSLSAVAGVDSSWRLQLERLEGLGAYRLHVAVTPGQPQDDCGAGRDAGNVAGDAVPLALPALACAGGFGLGEYEDWYRVPLAAGDSLAVALQPNAEADFDLCLYRPSDLANAVACSEEGLGLGESLEAVADEAGDWGLRVANFQGSGAYTLSASATSPAA